MLKIAITGNIGSGKSTVVKIFQSMNIPVFVADKEARELYKDDAVKIELKALFGEQVFDKENEVDKKSLAQIIFNNKKALKKINDLIHPLTLARYQQWLHENRDSYYSLHESAILFENHLEKQFDATIFVYAPEKLRIERVMSRDKVERQTVIERIKNQWPDDDKLDLADFIINNDGETFLIPQVLELDKILKLL